MSVVTFLRQNDFTLLIAHFMACKAAVLQYRLRVMASLVREVCKLEEAWDRVKCATLYVSMLLS